MSPQKKAVIEIRASETAIYALKHNVTCARALYEILDGPIDPDTYNAVVDLAIEVKAKRLIAMNDANKENNRG
jgi:hypothetical protein